jgi:hypothetical protein
MVNIKEISKIKFGQSSIFLCLHPPVSFQWSLRSVIIENVYSELQI